MANRPRTRASSHHVAGGTAQIAGAVARSLGQRWRHSWRATGLEQTHNGWRVHGPEVIQATRVVAAVTPEILQRLHPPLRPVLVPAEWAPVAVVWLGLEDPVLPDGFGVLVGPDEGFITLGFLYESSHTPRRAPPGRGLVKAIVGGARGPAVVERDDGALTARVSDELARVLGATPSVDMAHVVRHRPGIPQYTAARHHMVEDLRRALPPGLDVSGWAYDGVGVSHLATAATRLANP